MAVLMPEPQGTQLGKSTVYADRYDPKLLQPIPRALGRDAIGDHDFRGTDIWRLYEFSWLNERGLPQAAAVELTVPASSPSIIESKSLKLYQGSFAQTRMAGGPEAVAEILRRDLSEAAGAPVGVELMPLSGPGRWRPELEDLPGTLLEEAFPDVAVDEYEVNPDLIRPAGGETHAEIWRTCLFRSLCPVTGQPDYASVSVTLSGESVDPRSLLRYLASYRCHRGFHEQCVEQIFHDLRERLTLDRLDVQACFTRRGGIDINPFRSNVVLMPEVATREPRQ